MSGGLVICFNGAATFRLRKGGDIWPALARERGFNGAATFRLRKEHFQWKAIANPALQWGRNLSVAEGGRSGTAGARPEAASMGPQPFGCGRPACPRMVLPTARLQWGRNLSVAEGGQEQAARMGRVLLQWGRNLSVAEGRLHWTAPESHSCFNGAATFRLRKVAAAPNSPSSARGLQWGRNLSVAEGSGRWCGRARGAASMGPQPFGCGRGRRRLDTVEAGRRFNGAATFRLRKACRSRFLSIRMELQWGRNLSVAEGESCAGNLTGTLIASMGPQPFGCGRPQ